MQQLKALPYILKQVYSQIMEPRKQTIEYEEVELQETEVKLAREHNQILPSKRYLIVGLIVLAWMLLVTVCNGYLIWTHYIKPGDHAVQNRPILLQPPNSEQTKLKQQKIDRLVQSKESLKSGSNLQSKRENDLEDKKQQNIPEQKQKKQKQNMEQGKKLEQKAKFDQHMTPEKQQTKIPEQKGKPVQIANKQQSKTKKAEVKQQQNKQNPKEKLDKNKKKIVFQEKRGITVSQQQRAYRFFDMINQGKDSALAKEERDYYEGKYHLSKYPQQPFCIVVPSYNNVAEGRYLRNLNSIFQQEYGNYRVIYMDDASEDGTGELVRQYASDHQISEHKMKVVVNPERRKAMPNIYRAAHEECLPHELFLILDGDDELLGRQVLKFFSFIFQSKDAWVAYSNHLYSEGKLGFSQNYHPEIVAKNTFRKNGMFISHLRVFYTKLFLLIEDKDLKDANGNWFTSSNDVAMYMPILEMSGRHFFYARQICYKYNDDTGLNLNKVKRNEQRNNELYIKKQPPYQPLPNLFDQQEKTLLKESLSQSIPIKDLSLPAPENVETLPWEL